MNRRILYSVLALLAACMRPVSAMDLKQAYQAALQRDPIVLQAKTQWLIAKQHEVAQSAALKPQVDLSTAHQRIDTADTTSTSHSYTLTLQQALFDQKALKSLDNARWSTRAAHAVYVDALQQLIVRVSKAYFGVLSAVDQRRALLAAYGAGQQAHQSAAQRVQVGLATATDLMEAKAKLDGLYADRVAADSAVDAALGHLSEITGQRPKTVRGLGHWLALKQPKPAKLKAWVHQMEQHNYALQAERSLMQAARANMAMASAVRYPSVAALGQAQDGHQPGSSHASDKTMSLGVVLNMPVYHGGAMQAGAEAAALAYHQSTVHAEQTHRQWVNAIRQAYLGVLAGISQAKAQKQAVASSKAATDAVITGLKVGTRTTLDVLNAKAALAQREHQHLLARLGYLSHLLSLKQAAALLGPHDIAGINHFLVRKINL